MPICPLHRVFTVLEGLGCPRCEEEGIVAKSVEYDKQDRVRDTMLYAGMEFLPARSRAVMVFKKKA